MDSEPASAPSFLDAEWTFPDVVVLLSVPLVWRAAVAWFADRLTTPISLGLSAVLLAWQFLPLGLARFRRHPAGALRPRRRWYVEAPIGLALALAGWAIVVVLTNVLAGATRGEIPGPVSAGTGLVWLLVVSFFAVFVGPPAEEVFFRGFLYRALRRRLPRLAAAFLQAFVFAIVHPFPLLVLPAIFLLGLAFAFALEWRRTLLAPIFFHAAFNGITSAAAILWVLSAWWTTPILDIQGEPRPGEGWQVVVVVPGSGAEAAGLEPGDRIVGIGARAVASVEDAREVLAGRSVGDPVEVEFVRDGEARRVTVRLGRRPFPWY